ncbi:PQQ-binding-like beta-propeller repeat protein [Bacteroidota bacterium]
MHSGKLEKYIIPIIILVSILAFTFWFVHDPVENLAANVPGMDNRPKRDTGLNEVINIGESLFNYTEHTSLLTGKWPRFRGSDVDNINKENIPLINSWGEGPKILWNVDLGEGHAAPAIYNGKVYLLDYDEIKKADALKCFALETGELIWKLSYKVHVKRNHGISRTIPVVTDKYVVSIGPRGHVMCAEPNSGKFLWGIDLVKEYNTEIPYWYTGQCPFIENDLAIIAPGGSSMIIAVDCASGDVVWETENPDNWKMSHSSVMPMNFAGKKMYVYCAVGGICGISAEGADRGKILWKTNKFSPSVVAPSPLILDNGKILITAGYGAGSGLFQLHKEGENFSVEMLQKYKPKDGLASEQQTPLFYKGHIFSILPKDAGSLRLQLVCTNTEDCTNFVWTSGKTERFGLGPYFIADDKFFILDDDGTLSIAKADISSFTILDKARIIEGQDAWGPLALADGFLLMRDSKQMVCIDIRRDN